ncbi:MAG: DNA cytosine methyltransferase [Roseiflexaceae bacterium]
MTLAIDKQSSETELATLLPQKSFAEFFAGIGLMRMGLELGGWSIAFANDIDPQKLSMYKGQFPDAEKHFNLGDVHQIPTNVIPSVTLATASFPCNDLSLAGAREGLNGKESSAFWGFIRILNEMNMRRPPLVLLENVPGLLTSHGGSDFHRTLQALNRLGYYVDSFMLDAVRFVPQSRQRLFIIGTREELLNDTIIETFQKPIESDVRPKALVKFIWKHDDIQWSIRTLPPQPTATAQLSDILDELPDNAPEWWDRTRAFYLLSQMSPTHRERADRMIAGKEWSYGTVFRRMRSGQSTAELRTDGIAGCLRTPRGGSARQILFQAGYGTYRVRLLTPKECARLMGADSYNITVPLTQALFGFGDAVCVPVIEWICKNYFNPLIDEIMSRNQSQELAQEVTR